MNNKNLVTTVFVGLVALVVILGCGGGEPVDPKFQGDWTGENGTTISMTSDGKASFRSGNKKVTGGAAVIDKEAKTLTISLFGISQTWKIDEEPGEDGEMKLSGVIFRRK